MDEPKELTQRY